MPLAGVGAGGGGIRLVKQTQKPVPPKDKKKQVAVHTTTVGEDISK